MTRQELLLNLLEKCDRKLSRREIQKIMPYSYEFTHENNYKDKGLHLLTKDIQDINNNPYFERIILSNPGGVWLGNEQETREYLESERKAILKRLYRYNKKVRQVNKNNQVDIESNIIRMYKEKENE